MSTSIKIEQFEFSKKGILEIETDGALSKFNWAINWPTIYILNNKKEAYVGESYKVKNRLEQHMQNDNRKKLTQINILIDKESNKSYTLDIESFLIRYMSVDGTFLLQNGNHGLVDYNYFNKESYHKKFKENIWPALKKLGLAKRNLIEIENDDLFKFSPYTSLSEDQYSIIEKLINVFSLQPPKSGNILIEGGPGTGKTLLGVYLMKFLHLKEANFEDDDVKNHMMHIQNYIKKVGLVIPQSSLRKTLKKVFTNTLGLNSNMVLSPHDVLKDNYDLLIVDEAHRLRQRKNLSNYGTFDENNRKNGFGKDATELDWILSRSKYQIFFYDQFQTIKPTDIHLSDFYKKLDSKRLEDFKLKSQFRVKAGDNYIEYISDILNNKNPEIKNFRNYDIKFFDSFKKLKSEIKKRDIETGLARLVAGYGWDWISKKDKNKFDIIIEGEKIQWNTVAIDWVNSRNSVNEMGCIHTIQGYDLNYTGVIFGPEISFDEKTQRIVVLNKNYFDRNGKAGIKNQEELENYIKNIYFVLMTRGIKGTFIYVYDKKLRNYLQKFFQKIEQN